MNSSNQIGKYFVLHHLPTGLMRFFIYPTSSLVVGNNVFFGINVNRPTRLFNFMGSNIVSFEQQEKPSLILSPDWSMNGATIVGAGFQPNHWYGFEIQWALDKDLQAGTEISFALWAERATITTGSAITKGTIDGTIINKKTNSNGLNLSFNSSQGDNFSITQNNYSSIEDVAQKIEEGVNKKNNFFTSLWKDIEKNASKWIGQGVEGGVRSGVNTIISKGGSEGLSILSGLFSSL